MNICIDGLSMSALKGTGLYSYSYVLFSNLFEMYPQPKYEMIWNGEPSFPAWSGFKNVTLNPLKIDRKNNNYRPLEEYLTQSGTKLYHSPNNGLSIPLNKVCKYIISVHDLSPVSCSQIVDKKYYQKFSTLFPNAVEKADCIIAVSRFIREELLRFYRVPEKKIEVIYPWCSDIFRVLDLNAARAVLSERYKINGKYILYAGSVHSRKNLDFLIRTFKLVTKDTDSLKLVIAGNCDGKRSEYYLSLVELVKTLGLEKQVLFTGTVPYEDMPYFYNCAECTVNLSSYDGFPITAIEAVACSSPLICTRTPLFNEVVGESAVFIESLDSNLLKRTMVDVLNSNAFRNRTKNEFHHNSIKNYGINAINKLVRIYETAAFGTS